jgi:hypothetical protein
VVAAVGDVAEQLAELRPELPDWDDLRHGRRVYRIAYTALLAFSLRIARFGTAKWARGGSSAMCSGRSGYSLRRTFAGANPVAIVHLC